jgi:apolipoprotein N-acyltransferase
MTAAPTSAPDPYEPVPTLWQRHPQLGWVLMVFGLTAFLAFAAFPPLNIGDAGYALAIPAVLWAYRRPPFRLYAWTVLGAQVLAWILLFSWLHHVTVLGPVLLGPFVGLLTGVWYLAVWWVVPRLRGQSAARRILALLGLAALWVMLEWLRTVLFGGMPWLPLAASQWQRPLVLQSAAYAGAWSVSFILIYFNLAGAAYAHRIFFEGHSGLRKRSPEFMVALMLLVSGSFPFLAETMGAQRQKLARVTFVQPYIPQNEKWDQARATDVLQTIERTTLAANKAGRGDFILWPESVVPWPLFRDPNVEPWLESIAKRTGRPLLLGTVYTTPVVGTSQLLWYNGAFVVDPVIGVGRDGYAKRKLVPFGEYIPLRPVLGWLDKLVPIGGDFQPGTEARPLLIPVGPEQIRVGVLICYEDIFPEYARDSVQAGAEVLAVLTNDAWYGEGGAAYQHAAASVLRAVENRRPVLRCGNGGWSGWIDEFGNIRATLRNESGTIYFRGFETINITRDQRWRDRLSFYAQHGDWFVLVCAGLVMVGYYLVLNQRPPRPLRPGEEARF